MFALLWLFLIMPSRRRAQAQRQLIAGVEVGDEILTVGGIYGRILRMSGDDELLVEIAPDTRGARRPPRRGGRAARPKEERAAARGSRFRAERASPQLTCSLFVNRRSHLILVALIVAGLIGVGLLAVPGSPLHQKPTLGLDLQGGLEVTLQAVPPPNRAAPGIRPRPLGRDPPRPRRPARRRGARDPQAGRRPDRDRPAGPEEPGAGDRDPRQDRAARALRPRVQPRAAVDRARRAFPSRRSRSTRSSPASRRSSTRTPRRPGTCSTTSRSCAQVPKNDRDELLKSKAVCGGRQGGHAAEGVEDLRRAAEDGCAQVRHRRGRLPGRRRGRTRRRIRST